MDDTELARRWAPTLIPQAGAGQFENPKGGLNDAGRKHFGVKKGVTSYASASEEDKKRWVRWALRFTKNPQPLKDDNGHPTRYALMFRAWGEPVPASASAVKAVHDKALTRSRQLHMGENAAQLLGDLVDEWDALSDGQYLDHLDLIDLPDASTHLVVSTHDRPTAPTVPAQDPQADPGPADEDESGKAFLTEINGKTFLTASAQVASLREPSVEDIAADRMLMMNGRFVGADEPNRNGAMWSAADLEAARATVVNGPLNWLHEARHVIGTLTEAVYVPGEVAADGAGRPHISATAGIWKWIYPDEAYVVQQASDSQMLWYSMECISKEVACAGEGGCGNTTTYSAYMAGAACEHVKERASVRQFKNPVFLGGAVIVPPTRPGWAHADAKVMNQANALAEAAYEDAGSPSAVTASQWEQLMAQLVTFAR